ncbi:uncharacterized protein J4E87_004592 [Alternaria ethzedia]|uniref:uncharacterized protein n=1 Tax=Alternaria ethzedia TaxID=181014 RepID=UPI0020C3B912|nr:uncharacterized protein J4E87_004592 [Alternaria ethzedia]KAI4627248.1 hypothetical protein J4E87_004592 [Alternaria ethzedia]
MYKSLTSATTIRVLHIHPAPETDPLTCSLEDCDLDNDPEYEAISYVWGNSDLSCSLTCDSKVIAVTCSLHEALLRIRLPERHRTVWIDGLCINQIDDVEKSHQVQLMQRVFRNAHRVLVWLGPDVYGFGPGNDHGYARDAFDICSTLGQRDIDSKDLEATLRRMDQYTGVNAVKWGCLRALSNQPWWGRVWIIQEFALAKDLLFLWGAEEIQWTHINLAISNLQKSDVIRYYTLLQSTTLEPISRLSAIKDQRCYATSFMGTIHTARAFGCSDNRDRIFAILGLECGDDRWEAADPAGQSLAKATIPDYTLPAEHVYRQFAIRALQRGLTEDIFLAVQHEEQLEQWQPGDMPSWSPRWDLPLVNNFPSCHRLHEICKFHSLSVENGISFTGSTPKPMSALQSNFDPLAADTLNVLSATLDKIVALSEPIHFLQFMYRRNRPNLLESFWEQHIRPREATNGYKAVMTDLCENATYYMTSENHVSVFYAVIQQYAEKSPEAIADYAKHGEHAMLRSVAQLLLETSEIASVQDPSLLDKEFSYITHRLRFFITQRGCIGRCPAAVRPGDHVALLWNTACPVILRPQDGFYRIVGGSYMAALNRKRTEGVSHPLDDLLSGKSRPGMIQIR